MLLAHTVSVRNTISSGINQQFFCCDWIYSLFYVIILIITTDFKLFNCRIDKITSIRRTRRRERASLDFPTLDTPSLCCPKDRETPIIPNVRFTNVLYYAIKSKAWLKLLNFLKITYAQHSYENYPFRTDIYVHSTNTQCIFSIGFLDVLIPNRFFYRCLVLTSITINN